MCPSSIQVGKSRHNGRMSQAHRDIRPTGATSFGSCSSRAVVARPRVVGCGRASPQLMAGALRLQHLAGLALGSPDAGRHSKEPGTSILSPRRSDPVADRAQSPEVASRADVTGAEEVVYIFLTARQMAHPAARRALLFADDGFFPSSVRDEVAPLVTELVTNLPCATRRETLDRAMRVELPAMGGLGQGRSLWRGRPLHRRRARSRRCRSDRESLGDSANCIRDLGVVRDPDRG